MRPHLSPHGATWGQPGGDQSGSRPNAASSLACGSSAATSTRSPMMPAPRYSSSRSANHDATAATNSGSSAASPPVATATSHPWMRWSADQLGEVLRHVLVAVRQVHLPAGRPELGGRRGRLGGGLAGHRDRVVTEQVAVELIADLGDGPADQQRCGPAVLPDDVVDELSHVPIRARRRVVPPIPSDGGNPLHEPLDRPSMQLDRVHDTPRQPSERRYLASSATIPTRPASATASASSQPNHSTC